MNVQAIVLPYYGIGDFLSNLAFINALLRKFPKDKFIIFTKSRTKAKNLMSNIKNVKIFYIKDKYNFFSSITNLFFLRSFFLKKKIKKIWIFHRSPRYAIVSFFSKVKDILGYGYGIQKLFLNSGNFLNNDVKKSIPVIKAYQFLKINNVKLDPLEPFLKVSNKNITKIRKKFKKFPKPWILIGFSSTDKSRTWKNNYFAQLIQLLNKKKKCTFFLVGAPYESDEANKIIKLSKLKRTNIKNFCRSIEETMALMKQSYFYIGNDAGNAHLSLACNLKTYIIHGGSPPYSQTLYKKNYPKKFLKNLNPILASDGVIRNPNLKTTDTVPQEHGMDLIKPEYVCNFLF